MKALAFKVDRTAGATCIGVGIVLLTRAVVQYMTVGSRPNQFDSRAAGKEYLHLEGLLAASVITYRWR